MPSNGHAGFGERSGETDRWQHRHRAPGRLNRLGDYIYEGNAGNIRDHDGPVARTLAGYRNRYALYKTDEYLQAAHALFPFIVTPDDHEVANNWAGENEDPDFLQRRADAFQAFWEHLPFRPERAPTGPHMSIYRRFAFGDLISVHVLDTRQYRSKV